MAISTDYKQLKSITLNLGTKCTDFELTEEIGKAPFLKITFMIDPNITFDDKINIAVGDTVSTWWPIKRIITADYKSVKYEYICEQSKE